MSNLPDLEALAVFARVAELRSFSAAALELQLSKATVSKAVARLEVRIGSRLLNRSSHRLALTDAGRRLQERALRMLAEAEAAEAECLAEAAAPRGLVRLAAPLSFGLLEVAPLLGTFLKRHPEVSLDLNLSDALVDLIGEGFDAALRIGVLKDSALIARRLRQIPMRVVGAPAYLGSRAAPGHPSELSDHPFLAYAYSGSGLTFEGPDGEIVRVRPGPGRLRATNGDALVHAVRAGVGLALLPEFIVAKGLAAGDLVALLPAWTAPAAALHLVTPPGGPRPPRVAALLAFLVETLHRD